MKYKVVFMEESHWVMALILTTVLLLLVVGAAAIIFYTGPLSYVIK